MLGASEEAVKSVFPMSSPLNREQYIKPLTDWVEEVVANQLWEKSIDLHIDVLDAQFKQPGRWVEASLFVLSCFQNIVDKSKYEILLTIPLESSAAPTDGAKLHPDTLEKSVDSTPPSFYLFPLHFPTFDETLKTSVYLPYLSRLMNCDVYFKEIKEDAEYYRWLFMR